jgi:hypothetical protein
LATFCESESRVVSVRLTKINKCRITEPSEPDLQHQRLTDEPQLSRSEPGSLEPSRTIELSFHVIDNLPRLKKRVSPDFPHFPLKLKKKFVENRAARNQAGNLRILRDLLLTRRIFRFFRDRCIPQPAAH